MSVDIKVISVDEKMGKVILMLKGYIYIIYMLYIRLWLYSITRIIKSIIYSLTQLLGHIKGA